MSSEFKETLKKRLDTQIRDNPTVYRQPFKIVNQRLKDEGLKVVVQIQFTLNCAADDFDKRDAGRDAMYAIMSNTMAEFRGRGVEYTCCTVQMLPGGDSLGPVPGVQRGASQA
mmetsp:Transcript_26868/g.75633  ORF Transcript_26868/g.75633 Transcript_26868/m.75633 type:complete len:113 (-) Transcript_26868:267-605(-)